MRKYLIGILLVVSCVVTALLGSAPVLAADKEQDAIDQCTTHAEMQAEFVTKRDKPESDPYDAVAIGSLDRVEGGMYIVSGEVTVNSLAADYDYDYLCRYNPADTGSNILEMKPAD